MNNELAPYARKGYGISHLEWHAIEDALGLPRSESGTLISDVWDRIAEATGVPTTEGLKRAGQLTLPAWAWNKAVDIAFGTNHPPDMDRS